MSREIFVVVLAAAAFAVGLVAAMRLLVVPRRDREDLFFAWLARLLIAAGVCVAALRGYDVVRVVILGLGDSSSGIDIPGTVSTQVVRTLWESGTLLGLAAVVHLLATRTRY